MGRRSQKTWTEPEDRQLFELRTEGKSTAQIAKVLGRSEEAVRQRLTGIGMRSSVKLLQRKPDNN
jgi:DNA-binding CsgD family transcriptional regulator